MSPRQILGSGEAPVLHPFGARVTIGLSKGMNNSGREANALGNSKTQQLTKSIAGIFLCPAKYHPELMPGLRSMSSATLLIVSSGKRIASKNYFCAVDLSRQARRFTESKVQCENQNDKASLADHESPSTS